MFVCLLFVCFVFLFFFGGVVCFCFFGSCFLFWFLVFGSCFLLFFVCVVVVFWGGSVVVVVGELVCDLIKSCPEELLSQIFWEQLIWQSVRL